MKSQFSTFSGRCAIRRKSLNSGALGFTLAALLLSVIPALSLELNKCPSRVQETISALSQGGSISGAALDDTSGEPLYSITIHRDGTERRWTLDSNGVPLSASVAMKEIPEPVQRTIQQLESKAGPLSGITRSYEGGEVVYEPVFDSGSLERAYTIDAAGATVNWQIPLTEVPQRVLKRFNALFKGASIRQCFFSEEDKEPFFTLLALEATGPRWVTFDSKGEISEEEEIVAWEAAPQTLQKAIIQKTGSNRHVRILRFKDEDTIHHEIWTFAGGKLVIFWILSDGSISMSAPGQ